MRARPAGVPPPTPDIGRRPRAAATIILLLGAVATTITPAARASATARRPIALDRPVTYVAIGASDAVGVGANDPATETWPVVLDTLLPSGSKLVNLGVPGITLARALDVELPVALDALPSRPIARNVASGRGVVTVWLAVNDLRGVSLEVAAGDIYS